MNDVTYQQALAKNKSMLYALKPTVLSRARALTIAVSVAVMVFIAMCGTAIAQSERQKIVGPLVAAAEKSIQAHKPQDSQIRLKVIGRISLCSFLLATMRKQTNFPKEWDSASEIFLEMAVRLSNGISAAQFKQITTSARQELDNFNKRQDKKEALLLIRSCQSFTDDRNMDVAVAELLYYNTPTPKLENKNKIIPQLEKAIENSIKNNLSRDSALRRKVIARLYQCGVIHSALSKGDPKSKEVYQVFLSLALRISKNGPLPVDFKSIVERATEELERMHERQNEKEAFYLLRNCQAFGDPQNTNAAILEVIYLTDLAK